MTSVSQQTQIPSQATNAINASQSSQSYASATKKAVSSPPIATSSSTPSPALAVGGAAPVQQHAKSSSISPVNGRPAITPAVPVVTTPAVLHSTNPMSNSSIDHGRKSSVTISANGGYIPNGGPVGSQKAGIPQFGSLQDSPASSYSIPQITQPTSSAPISIPSNPRITSPTQSPSPIPQPPISSGGRPPSGLAQQGNVMIFGSPSGDGDRHMRTASMPQGPGPLAPGTPPTHLRRESSGDMNNQGHNAANRGGFQAQGGRGRGYNPTYQQQSMGYAQGPQYRGTPAQGRGNMPPPFQGQGRPMGQYPNSPHQTTRSPALTNSMPSMPSTPNMGQAMPMQAAQQYGGYPQHYMGGQQVHYPSTSNHSTDSFKTVKGKNAKHKHRTFSKPSQQSDGPTEPSRELFGHSLSFNGRNYSERPERGYPEPPFLLPPYLNIPSFSKGIPKIDLSPESGNFERLTNRQNFAGYQPQYDRMTAMPIPTPYSMYPQMQYMQGMPQPQSPQPGYQQPYSVNPYSNPPPQAQSMSRTSSQMSERPNSSLGQPQTSTIPPVAALSHTPQPKPSAVVASSAIHRTARKSAAIPIKTPDGDVLQIPSAKPPASPAQSNRSGTPPVVTSTPTPPPKSVTPQHNRTESATAKSQEQIRSEFKEQFRKKAAEVDVKAVDTKSHDDEAAAAAAAEAEAKEAAKAAEEAQAKEEARIAEEEKIAAEAKAKEEADAEAAAKAAAKAAAEKAKQDEEDELERQIKEMEEAEELREKAEAELLARRAAEKAEADKVNAEKNKLLAEENDRRLREQEREMERLEDERERKRLEAEAKAEGRDVQVISEAEADAKKEADDLAAEVKADNKEIGSEESSDAAKEAPNTPNTLASKLSNLTLGMKAGDSGASTPASDDSMGPPPKMLGSKRPAALHIPPLNTKPVEPPQPSAALQSLKSARFLSVLNSSLYPPNIMSPNPALNPAVAARGRTFKYDKDFLLQFQKVFMEKPSVEFESQIKSLIGDGDGGSARPGSSKHTPGGMGPRQNSRQNAPGVFAMGTFGAVGNSGKTLPSGTTSAERFAMSQGAIPRPAPNPMASFNRPGGAFPGTNPMQRTPSSSHMGNMGPHSPRQQNSSKRQNSKRDPYKDNKQEAQAAKMMPLTAGMDLKPIQVTSSGWKPRTVMAATSATGAAGPAPGASGSNGHMDPDMVQRKVKAALNKMTPEKFDKIADQILAIAAQSKDEADGRTLRQVIQLTFEKATDEAHWASMYAKFCKRMLETMSPDIKDESILDKNGNVVSGGNLFRKYLLNRCQEEFERGWKTDIGEKPEGEEGEEKTAEAVMLSDQYYIAAAAKRRGLGLVQFIGELYKLGMLTERIMHECVKKLVDYTGVPDEAEIESLTKLLKTIGANLDSTEKGRPMMDVYFQRIQAMIDTPDLPSRLKFMLMDIVDLRKKRWHSKEDNKGPKTLEEVRAEAEAAAAQKATDNARGNQRGGGGSGRMQMGRGDSRNFSGGQYGNQPPVDYTKNTVATDDLRRLGSKNATRQSGQAMSFGPPSMFASRSNSGRKMGPGGSLSRTGEDSGGSSRTGTPPQQKEKENASHANTFSLLADLSNSGEPENPASPPSVAASPALSKVIPVPETAPAEKESET